MRLYRLSSAVPIHSGQRTRAGARVADFYFRATLRTARFIILLLSGALFGCSTAPRPAAVRQTNSLPLYIYWGSEEGGSAIRFLSARIHFDEPLAVGGDDFLELRGTIERRGTNFIADLLGNTGQQSQFYRGNVRLEKPFFAQGGAASGGAGPGYWFLISTNLDCRTVLEDVNRVRGLTNAPFSHPAETLPPPVSNAPTNIDPATGLPWGNRLVDPITGLPLAPHHDK